MKKNPALGGIFVLVALVAMLAIPVAIGHFTLAKVGVAGETEHAKLNQ